MTAQPSMLELVQAVEHFLAHTARPGLTGHAAFHARVAENVLAIVRRELEQGRAASDAARARLIDLLNAREDETLDALNTELCRLIACGDMDWQTPGLLEHLKAATINQLEIDQPSYSGLALATKAHQNE